MTELDQKHQRAPEERVTSLMHHNLLVFFFYHKCHNFSVRHVSVFDVVGSLICDTAASFFSTACRVLAVNRLSAPRCLLYGTGGSMLPLGHYSTGSGRNGTT